MKNLPSRTFDSLNRALRATLAYLATSAVLLVSAVALKHALPPAVTQGALSVFFISALVSGLEPGTAKAAALRAGGEPLSRKGLPGIFWASCVKGLAAAPVIVGLWKLSSPEVAWAVLAWTPLLVTTGFLATDFRVLLDVRGEHSTAIWLKQGPMALGFASLTAVLLAGHSLGLAVAASTMLRLLMTLWLVAWRLGPRLLRPAGAALGEAIRMLRDGGWPHFALVSALAALSGSLDRLVALRALPPADYNGYFIAFEVLSKFWLLAYLAGPIVFARRATGMMTDRTIRQVHLGIWILGAGYLAAIAAIHAGWSREMGALIGQPGPGLPALLALGGAILISSSAQVNVVDIQARGGQWLASGLTMASLVTAAVVFSFCAHRWGYPGLLWGWLAKSSVELALGLLALRKIDGRPPATPAVAA